MKKKVILAWLRPRLGGKLRRWFHAPRARSISLRLKLALRPSVRGCRNVRDPTGSEIPPGDLHPKLEEHLIPVSAKRAALHVDIASPGDQPDFERNPVKTVPKSS